MHIGVCYRSAITAVVGGDKNEHLLELITEVGNNAFYLWVTSIIVLALTGQVILLHLHRGP